MEDLKERIQIRNEGEYIFETEKKNKILKLTNAINITQSRKITF